MDIPCDIPKVIQAGVRAGRLPEKITVVKHVFRDGRVVEEKIEKATEDCYIDVNFPPLRQEDIEKLTRALQTQQEMGIKSDRTIATELGVEDWEQEQALLVQEREIRQAQERQDDTNKWPPFEPAQNPK